MDQGSARIKWILGLFFGWLLSFPLHGPVLIALSAARSVNFETLGLSFELFQAIGLVGAGLMLPQKYWRQSLVISVAGCLLFSSLLLFFGVFVNSVVMAFLGLLSGVCVIGWSFPYTFAVTKNRIRLMATTILIANVVLYVVGLIIQVLPLSLACILAQVPLVGAFLLSRGIKLQAYEFILEPHAPLVFPKDYKLVFSASSLIFFMYICGGLLYNVVLPSFQEYAQASLIFGLLPYMGVLALIMFYGSNFNRLLLVNLGLPLLGLGFVCFALFRGSIYGFYLTNTLILAAFGILDVFLWTAIGDVGKVIGAPFQTFGIALALNLLGLYVGGTVGVQLVGESPVHDELAGLIASITIFASLMLAPYVLRLVDDKLRLLVSTTEVAVNAEPQAKETVRDLLPNCDQLTDREMEIVSLVLGGHTNLSMAETLFISENTIKIHLKNINRKLGVSSKYELLSLVLRQYQSERKSS